MSDSDDLVSAMLQRDFGRWTKADQEREDCNTRTLERAAETLKLVIRQRDEAISQRNDAIKAMREALATGDDTLAGMKLIRAAFDTAITAVTGVKP